MTVKTRFLWQIIFAAFFFLISSLFLLAQDMEPQYVRLVWTEDESSYRYEVVIEKEEEGKRLSVLQEFTDTFFIEVLLPPGQYRCQVIPYDFLEKPGEVSQWISFKVQDPKTTRPPEPEPDSEPVYLSNRYDLVVNVRSQKKFGIYISGAWMPLFPIYGKENTFFDENISLLGAALRFGALYTNFNYFNPGLELTGSWYAPNAATAGLNLLAQIRFPYHDEIALRFRLGAGSSFTAEGQAFHANLGASFVWFPLDHFFLEIGLDYVHLLTKDPSGCLRPWLGVGWQF